MRWSEFCDLLSGLGPETALLRVAAVRAEEDPDAIRHFTPAQRRIRSQWRTRRAKQRSALETGQFLRQMQAAFAALAR